MANKFSVPVFDPSGRGKFASGLTLRSFLAALLGLLLMALAIQGSTVWLGMAPSGEYGLPLPAVVYLLILLGVGALLAITLHRRLLTRAELFCVFYVLVLAAPLMTQGFWHRMLSITATIPRTADFAKLQFLSDRLWPHGPNLLANAAQEEITLDSAAGQAVRDFVLPVVDKKDGKGLVPGEPYLLSFDVRVGYLDAESAYYVRAVRADGTWQEIYRSRQTEGRGTASNGGFFAQGVYGVTFGEIKSGESVRLAFGLQGRGALKIKHPQLLNVSALEFAYSGMEQVPADVYDTLPLQDRAGLIRRPANLVSLEGMRFLLGGGIPISDWLVPLSAWGSLIGLILLGAFALNVLVRRQWIDGEKYPLPLSQIPSALIGNVGDYGTAGVIWKNRGLWAGAILGLAWGLLKGLHFYNPAIPNTELRIDLSPYFGPSWGGFWTGVVFEVTAIFVAVAVFVELNVLISLIVGFLAFRALIWLGTLTGMSALPGYPFAQQQQTGAFLAYGFLILLLSHKHIRQTFREALQPSLTPPEKREVVSYRSAYLILAVVFLASMVWALWVGVSISGMLVFFSFMLLVALVASKFRAEAGIPFGYFTPANTALVLMLLGGIPFFGAEVVLLTFLASFVFSVAVFFLIPGAQLEMLELGRTYRVRPRDLMVMMALGLLGGVLIGGWIFLGHAYSSGGESMRYTWAFDSKVWYFSEFNAALTASSANDAQSWNPSHWAYLFGGVVSAILAVLRQLFAGFWMHPIGFVLGPSFMSQVIWGSLLVAWLLRFAFVRLGGGLAVRTKLQPFFIGVFIGACVSWTIWFFVGLVLRTQGADVIYGGLP